MAAAERLAPPLRLDRWLTLRLVAPFSAWWRTGPPPAIPLLMYHAISDEMDRRTHPYFGTVTTPRRFAQQVALLRRLGYQAVTLGEAAQLLRQPGFDATAQRRVVLSFDDGFSDFRSAAWPVLAEAGFTATVFVVSGLLGGRFHDGRRCLGAQDLRELSAQGVEFGSHSATHGLMARMTEAALARELRESRQVIEDCSGRAVRLFSYPYRFPHGDARFVQQLGGLLTQNGYHAGVTTAIGLARTGDAPLFLPRLPVNDFDDDRLLRAKLDGHYDWLRMGQALARPVRSLRQRLRPPPTAERLT